MNDVIQNKIDNALRTQSQKYMAGRISARQVVKGQHPEVDMSRLNI